MGGGGIEPPRQAFQAYTLPLSYPPFLSIMAKFFKSKFKLVKRYARFSNTCVYIPSSIHKKIRYGYKVYQKIFRKYRSRRALRINVRKPRVLIKRKTKYGKAIEIKEKFSYAIGGIASKKLKRYVRVSGAKNRSPLRQLLRILEFRLDVILYRINIIQSPHAIKKLVRFGYIEVNEEPNFKANFIVPYGSRIDVLFPWYAELKYRFEFFAILRRRLVFKPSTDYLEISYATFRSVIFSFPDEDTTFYPFDFKPHYFFRLYP